MAHDSTATVAATDFGDGGTILFIAADGCLPHPPHGTAGAYVFGVADRLPADHPLRRALAADELYWLEAASGTERQHGFVLGYAILDPEAGIQSPARFNFDEAIPLTKQAATAKRALRRKDDPPCH